MTLMTTIIIDICLTIMYCNIDALIEENPLNLYSVEWNNGNVTADFGVTALDISTGFGIAILVVPMISLLIAMTIMGIYLSYITFIGSSLNEQYVGRPYTTMFMFIIIDSIFILFPAALMILLLYTNYTQYPPRANKYDNVDYDLIHNYESTGPLVFDRYDPRVCDNGVVLKYTGNCEPTVYDQCFNNICANGVSTIECCAQFTQFVTPNEEAISNSISVGAYMIGLIGLMSLMTHMQFIVRVLMLYRYVHIPNYTKVEYLLRPNKYY